MLFGDTLAASNKGWREVARTLAAEQDMRVLARGYMPPEDEAALAKMTIH